jgi:hypothetical protein
LRACIHRDECACVVSVSDVLRNSKKNTLQIKKYEWYIIAFALNSNNIKQVGNEHDMYSVRNCDDWIKRKEQQ